MEFIVKKTTELTEDEQMGILSLFNTIFEKNRPLTHFQNQFLNNPLGYSFHSMIIDNERIVGCGSYIPSYYLVNGQQLLFANSVDTMVTKPYRDFANLYYMITTIYEYMKNEGVVYVYGFPNDNAYPVYVKSKLMQDIGSLTIYCLPYRIGGIKPRLKALNWLSVSFVNIFVFFTSLFAGKKIYHFSIEKENETFNVTRYKWIDGNYKIVSYKGSKFSYKIKDYKGIRSLFLIDVFEKSSANFFNAIQFLLKNHGKEFDALIYQGRLPFRFHGLIRIPDKILSKKFNFVGKILDNKAIDKDTAFNINNWDVNLSNYDF
jgi:hypothetical protein